ncbi:UNKNOWN [Stylonychia lemnae]|uniref:Uncharacterized protein n=1 Tax=Stylonychia lemnae TaxID=5949 RepID=A0A078ATA5_STYLE|nr:UNKNOWN [Stylonychia lemnae]|eukprot:CDW85685.1 UNKNOWN [Stylonychia lemnae]
MYLPSLNELNKSAVQQKVVEQTDERVRRNNPKLQALGFTSDTGPKFSMNPQDDSMTMPFNQQLQTSALGAVGPRRDRLGNLIKIGEKQHKLTFRDQIEKGEKLEQIFEVESWKQYNAPFEAEESAFSCKCSIF